MNVKICCISSVAEAQMAVFAGADVLGLVGHMPSGPGIINDELAAEIVSTTPDHIETFLLTSETTAEGVINHHHKVGSSAIQLVDALPAGSHKQISQALPEVKLVQVIHVIDQHSVSEALNLAGEVDALLLDSGNPNLQVKELGGTGRMHDWQLSQQIVRSANVPVYLAGGLKSENVVSAIQAVQPYGLDLCSGVRSKGQLDPDKLAAFMTQVKGIPA